MEYMITVTHTYLKIPQENQSQSLSVDRISHVHLVNNHMNLHPNIRHDTCIVDGSREILPQ